MRGGDFINFSVNKYIGLSITVLNKSVCLEVFKCISDQMKSLCSNYLANSTTIRISTGNRTNVTYNSIEEFENSFSLTTTIVDFEFSFYLSKDTRPNDDDVLILASSSHDYDNVGKIYDIKVSVSTGNNVFCENCLLSIEKNLISTFAETLVTPIPVQITTSREERRYNENIAKLDEHIRLKHIVISCIITAILSIFVGIIIGKLT